jgi:hypothetical protein
MVASGLAGGAWQDERQSRSTRGEGGTDNNAKRSKRGKKKGRKDSTPPVPRASYLGVGAWRVDGITPAIATPKDDEREVVELCDVQERETKEGGRFRVKS